MLRDMYRRAVVPLAACIALAVAIASPQAAAASPKPNLPQDYVYSMLLQSDDPNVRLQAAQSLAKFGSSAWGAVPALADALHDEHWEIRVAAALALQCIGAASRAAIPALAVASCDENPEVREAVAAALGQTYPFASDNNLASALLMASLGDVDIRVRLASAKSLRIVLKSTDEAFDIAMAVDTLAQSLNDENSQVRSGVLSVLSSLGSAAQAATPALIRALNDAESTVRQGAISTLSWITFGDSETVDDVVLAVAKSLDDIDSNVRFAAIRLLHSIANPSHVAIIPSLNSRLTDGSSQVRAFAALTLANLKSCSGPCLGALVGAMRDQDYSVQVSAIKALGEIGPNASMTVPSLLGFMTSKEPINDSLRVEASKSLDKIGCDAEKCIPFFISALEYRSLYDWSYSKLLALGKTAVPSLMALLAEGTGSTLQEAAIALLGAMGPEATEAVPKLFQFMIGKSNDWSRDSLRPKAAASLDKMGFQSDKHIPSLIAALEYRSLYDWSYSKLLALGKTAVPSLMALLSEGTGSTLQETAIALLGAMGPKAAEAVPKLFQFMIGKAGDWQRDSLRPKAATSLDKIGFQSDEYITSLVVALEHRQLYDWSYGKLLALGKTAVPSLVALLSEGTSSTLQEAAIVLLGAMGPKASEAVPKLFQFMIGKPGDWQRDSLRAKAATSLDKIGFQSDKYITSLIVALEHRQLYDWSHEKLLDLGNVAIPSLLALLSDGTGSTPQEAAIALLGAMGPDATEAVPKLFQFMIGKSNDWTRDRLRPGVAISLDKIGFGNATHLNSLLSAMAFNSTHDWALRHIADTGDQCLDHLKLVVTRTTTFPTG